jgi:hypothetical protein
MGIVTIGSSIGGTTIPIAIKQLIPRVGYIGPLFFENYLYIYALQISVDDENNRVFVTRSPGSMQSGT